MKNKEVYALILAGGTGQRMGNTDRPKQYINLNGKPVIIHTLEKFYLNPGFRQIIVLCPEQWIEHTRNLINRHIPDNTGTIVVVPGGVTRNETLMNGIKYIDDKYCVTDDTVIVTHDAVRPFVTARIIEENIKSATEFGACDTVMPATDTIVCSRDGTDILEIPDRNTMYQGQTPQSFKAAVLRKLYSKLSDEDKKNLTDAAKIYVLAGEKVKLVRGEAYNIKITYPFDIEIAKSLLGC